MYIRAYETITFLSVNRLQYFLISPHSPENPSESSIQPAGKQNTATKEIFHLLLLPMSCTNR